jgi:hypothetical protein
MFWHLFLAHLIGDYPLQSDWLVENKRNLWGLSLHVGIHLAVTLLILGSASAEVWPKVLLLIFVHFLLDLAKSSLLSKWPKHVGLQYVMDQVLHIVSIFLVASWIESDLDPGFMPVNTTWAVYAIGYLLVTYVWYITERLFTVEDAIYQIILENQFWPRMIVRAFMLTIFLFIGQSLEIVLVGMALLMPYRSGAYHRRTLVVDVLVSLAITAFILLAS